MRPEPNPKARETYLAHANTCAACAGVDRKVLGATRCADGMSLVLDVIYSEPILRRRAAQQVGEAKQIGGGR